LDLVLPLIPEPTPIRKPRAEASSSSSNAPQEHTDPRNKYSTQAHGADTVPDELPHEVSPPCKEIQDLIEIASACLSNRGACHLKQGSFAEVVTDCSLSLRHKPKYVKALQKRAEACERLGHKAMETNDSVEGSGKLQMAVDDLKSLVELDPSNASTHRLALYRLEPELARQTEKMKDEMIDKLKGFGNFLLGKVGLSLDNFKTQKDPVTGSYNIQFQQNK
jgi:tetratricopeptide (TPR) repeat protein